MSFLQASDFTGVIEQGVNEFSSPKIQLYIDKFETFYLNWLLGATLYDEFIADLDTAPAITPASVPTSARFTVIFNKFRIDEDPNTGCIHYSEGIKEMLKYFIYFEYLRDNQITATITGSTKNTFSNSEMAKIIETRIVENYNLGIKTYQEIQWYIDDENPNDYDYDNYNGVHKDIMSWL